MTIKIEIQFKVISGCCECGVPFAVPDYMYDRLRDSSDLFYCPNGHPQQFRISTVDKLKKQIKELEETKSWYKDKWVDERNEHVDTKNSLRATKAAHTRTKNRIAAGVCPCCNRHFEKLQRHIETKHPEYE